MKRPRWGVEDNGRAPRSGDVRIFVDGQDITPSVVSYSITHEAKGAAQLDIQVRGPFEVTAVGDTEPRWHGLEDLPTAALRAELGRRERSSE